MSPFILHHRIVWQNATHASLFLSFFFLLPSPPEREKGARYAFCNTIREKRLCILAYLVRLCHVGDWGRSNPFRNSVSPGRVDFWAAKRVSRKCGEFKVQIMFLKWISNLISEGPVHLLGWLHQQSTNKCVHPSVFVKFERFRLMLMQ